MSPRSVDRTERRQLEELLTADEEFMHILRAVRNVNPPEWAVGAGIIRDIIWDHLHSRVKATAHRDVDVAYFDPTDLSRERDLTVTRDLEAALPGVPWEAKNQAAVHTWYESRFGTTVEPLTSTYDAVGTWPETATCVAVRLAPDDRLVVFAPLGLSDLLHMTLRRNPRRVSIDEFERRVAEKRILERWPLVRIAPA